MIHPDWWGEGYATEAGSALLELAFDRLGLRAVMAACHPENVASARVLAKLGMARLPNALAPSTLGANRSVFITVQPVAVAVPRTCARRGRGFGASWVERTEGAQSTATR